MPEFYGDTLEEVLGKALGRRDEFGRRVKQFGLGGPKSNTTYPFDDPQRIETERQAALARARAFINGADHTARTESGIMFIYDKQTGKPITIKPTSSSFQHVGFDLRRYRNEIERYEMLAHAHTHVRHRSNDPHTRRTENERNRDWSDEDRDHLLNFAPGFMKNPFGDIISGGHPPFRSLREHPQL